MKRIVACLLLLVAVARPAFAADSVVVFNEVHYHPETNETAQEWIELHNQMAIDIDLSAWRIEDSVEYTFAEGTIIPGGGYLIIASNPSALQFNTGATNVLGPFVGRLNNGGGRIELRDRNDRLMDRLDYSDGGKWPVAADGSGATLAKRHPDARSGPPENWTSSMVSGGTPGRRNFPAATRVLRRIMIPITSLWRYEASGADLGAAWREPGFDDSAWSGRNQATLLSYWPLDGNATATRGTNGTFVGAITAAADRNNTAGGALAFAGAQHVSVASGGGLNGALAGTISMWVKWTGTQDADCCGTFGAVLARQANGVFSDNIIALNNANPAAARVVWKQNGCCGTPLITGSAIVGANWHHIAVTFTANGTSTLYVDGIVQGTAIGPALNNNPNIPLAIGAWSGDGGGFSTASIDDVAIWDQPLGAAQVAELFAQTKTPLDFATPETGVYYAGDGRLSANDELRRTAVPLGPTTHYFRNTFHFAGDPAQTRLQLHLAVDDGAVVYLNGAEVLRRNIPPGPVAYSTFAANPVGDAVIEGNIPISTANLLPGANVLAVEVHQAGPGDAGMIFGAGLDGELAVVPPAEDRLLIALHGTWKYNASNTDLGAAWRSPAYNDSAWSNGLALLFSGNAEVDGVPPERITGVVAFASTEYPDGRRAGDVVNGLGLIDNAHVTGPPNGSMWLNNGTAAAPNDLNPFIIFDLGGMQPIRHMKVWNYNEFIPGRPELLNRGVSRADILTGALSNSLTMHIAGQTLNQAPGTRTDFSQIIDLGGVNARFVKLERLTNFPGGDLRFVGLSEVQFFRDVNLKRSEIPWATTTYFRKAFNFSGDPAKATLLLNAVIDDGAIFYLNGVEVYRFNLPPGPVSHFTLATNPIDRAAFTGSLAISSTHLVRGINVLAVELHQTATGSDIHSLFGAEFRARMTPPSPEEFEPGALVFNELSAASTAAFQIELINRGTQSLDVGGYSIRRAGPSPDAQYALPSQTLAPGELLVLNQSTLGFGAVPGDKLFLLLPAERGIADALEVHERPRARSEGNTWLTPNAFTPGAPNSFTFSDAVVFNEIMYHAPPLLPRAAVNSPTNTWVTTTNLWRYHAQGVDLGTAWRAPAYDDAGWPESNAMFYAPSSMVVYPVPKSTLLALTNSSGTRIITFYFRTQFTFNGDTNNLVAALRGVIDDGAVFYLNGAEVLRMGMPTTNILYTTLAATNVSIPGLAGPLFIPASALQIGLNTLAVEVHQTAPTSADMNFALELLTWNQLAPALPFRDSPEQWVELFNRSGSAVNLAGWRLDEGIDYRFPANTTIPPGGYLVVAKDPGQLQTNFPGIAVVGPYTNSLSHRGERIVLKDAADNLADVVHYFDDGRWPRAADAGGASLELRDPRADNSAAEAWAASDETGRTEWRTYSYRAIATNSPVGPDGQWREFVIGLLDRGEVLLDDISVIETPATAPTNLIQNGTFDTGVDKWRIIGNHHGEVIDDPDEPGNKVLRLIATGGTEHMSNHGETTLAGGRDTVNGREYLISFRARWVSGSRQFHTRLYFNRLARTTLLDVPDLHGTPGSPNTVRVPNIGPTYSGLRHDPPVPGPFAPVTVSVDATDPDGISTMTLWWRKDGGSWNSLPMSSSSSFSFSSSISGQPSGSIVQFFVEGTDALGAISKFPAAGPASRALFQVDDALAANNGLHNFRIVTLKPDADELFHPTKLMSNERLDCTIIYDEQEIFYNTGLRLKGSEHSRVEPLRLGFNVSFDSEHRFRGIHDTVALDRSESVFFGQREMLIHQTLNHAGGLPTKYHDLVHIVAPRPQYTGSAELQLARYTDVFLDDQFEDGEDGTVFEYELVYQLNATDTGLPDGNKVPAADSVVGTAIRNLGADKEGYRWTFLIKNNEERDDFAGIMAFAQAMGLTGAAFTAAITNIIDVDQFLRGFALNVLSGMGDSYGGDGAAHNVQFYVRPSDGRVLYLPHDIDAFFDVGRSIVPGADLPKLLATPAYARAYYGHLLDIMATTYNVNYLTRWAHHFGRLLPSQDFASHLIGHIQRANNVRGQVSAAVPNVAFAITSNGGNNFGVSSNQVTLVGTAPISVTFIDVNGVSYPIIWNTVTTWSILLPLFQGANALNVQGVDRYGIPLLTAVDTITITNTSTGAPLPAVINEWMADNAGPLGLVDPADGLYQDWFEIYNPNSNALSLAGFYLTDNLNVPTKWLIPSDVVIPAQSFLLVWADNQPEQNATRIEGHLHAAFQLNRDGEALALFSPGGVAQHIVVFGDQDENISQGLFPDGDTNAVYSMTNWTPRFPNTLDEPLRIIDLSFDSGTLTVTWTAVPGRTYHLEYKNNFDATWTRLPPAVPAVDITASAIDTAPPAAHRFYRIVRQE